MLIEVVCLSLIVTVMFCGVVQPTVSVGLNSTAWLPTAMPVMVAPLLRQVVVPTMRHLAPARSASAGVMITVSEPV